MITKQLFEVLETLKAETEQSIALTQRLIAHLNQSSQCGQDHPARPQKRSKGKSK